MWPEMHPSNVTYTARDLGQSGNAAEEGDCDEEDEKKEDGDELGIFHHSGDVSMGWDSTVS